MSSTDSYIRFLSDSGKYEISISNAHAKELISAKEWIFFATAFEQRLDIALENFADIERTVLDLALQSRVFPGASDHALSDGMHFFNRRLINFLSSWKLYIQQTKHALSSELGRHSECLMSFENALSTEYDSRLGYRFVEALRNHSQHRALPTHAIRIGGSNDGEINSRSQVFHKVIFSINPTNLETEGGFKKEVLGELKSGADERGLVPMLPLIQEAMTGLCRIHSNVRKIMESRSLDAEKSIQRMFEKASSEADKRVGLIFVNRKEGRSNVKEVGIARYMLDPLQAYLRKNRYSGHFDRRNVSLR